MSVRAYRINLIKRDPNPTFNLWHDEKLMDFLENQSNFYPQLGDEGAGQSSVGVDVLKQAIKKAKSLELDKETIKQIKADIAFAESQGDTEVMYDCY